MDANDAASFVQDLAGEEANIIFGAKYDENMTDTAQITVIATGLEVNKKPSVTPLMSSMKYTSTASAAAGAARGQMNPGLTSRAGLSGAAGAAGYRAGGGAAGAAAGTGAVPAANNPAFTGIQKPKKPESSVPERDIQIPTFLKNTRR